MILEGDRHVWKPRDHLFYTHNQGAYMAHTSIDFDQDQRLSSCETLEQLRLEGIGDALNLRLPQQAQVPYLEGYCEGMRLNADRPARTVVLPVLTQEIKEYPLVCGQCTHLVDGVCKIKSTRRSADRYACDCVNCQS
jgi:hypothetical protein